MNIHPSHEEIAAYLAEDIGGGDLTAQIIPEAMSATALVTTREEMVLCGQAWFDAVFWQLSQDIGIEWFVKEGDAVEADTKLCRLHGPACFPVHPEGYPHP